MWTSPTGDFSPLRRTWTPQKYSFWKIRSVLILDGDMPFSKCLLVSMYCSDCCCGLLLWSYCPLLPAVLSFPFNICPLTSQWSHPEETTAASNAALEKGPAAQGGRTTA